MVIRKPFILIIIIVLITILIFIYFLILKNKPRLIPETGIETSCNLTKSPQQCEILGDPCIQCNDGLYSCQNIDKDLPIKDGDFTTTLPKGKWCLPTKVENEKCNPYTSDPILTKIDDNLYKWICNCKYPNWVNSHSVGGNCNKQIACNHQYDPDNNYLMYCKNQGDYKQVVNNKGELTTICKDGSKPIKWDDNSNIQLENTFCKCGSNSYFFENKDLKVKQCVLNPCGDKGRVNYDSSGNMYCICPPGKVSCRQLLEDKQQECGIGCIDDPCKPNGTLNGKGTCDCNNGYEFMEDNKYLTGGYCMKKDDACNLLSNTCTEYRGGSCTTCIEPSGELSISVPYCYNCSYYKGFNNTSKPDCKFIANNCTPCALWFVDPNSDYNHACCTGRNHKYKSLFKRGQRECLPCNDPSISKNDTNTKKVKKQQEWDNNCMKYYKEDIDNGATNIPARIYCNSYKVGDNTDWSSDGRIGICETNKLGDGNRQALDRDMIRYD